MEKHSIRNLIHNTAHFVKAPLLELVGENRALIENHQGVLAYSIQEIQVGVNYGKIIVSGNDLKIMQMSKEQLVIYGQINQICLCRR